MPVGLLSTDYGMPDVIHTKIKSVIKQKYLTKNVKEKRVPVMSWQFNSN